MKMRITIPALLACALLFGLPAAYAQDKPNIVLVFMDNFGWGEPGFNGGGIIRGAPTPRIDQLASEGLRLTNFNVESQCTPSRAAIMSGRYAIRTGNGSIPLGGGVYGLVQWEVTMAEMLADAGYATGMFGKWHLGHTEGRFPTDQGFDEWYGIPNSSDETAWEVLDGYAESGVEGTYIYEGKKGSAPRRVMDYNLEAARADRPGADEAVDRLHARQVKAKQPFFLFVPYTQTHYPAIRIRISPARRAMAALPTCWPRSTRTTACCWTLSTSWESGTTRCSSSPRTTGRNRYLKDRTPRRSTTLSRYSGSLAGIAVHRLRGQPAGALRRSLARQDSRRQRQRRDRPRDGSLPDLRAHRRRQGAGRPRHRRRGPDRFPHWASRRSPTARG